MMILAMEVESLVKMSVVVNNQIDSQTKIGQI
jgi:hypothetical protein